MCSPSEQVLMHTPQPTLDTHRHKFEHTQTNTGYRYTHPKDFTKLFNLRLTTNSAGGLKIFNSVTLLTFTD